MAVAEDILLIPLPFLDSQHPHLVVSLHKGLCGNQMKDNVICSTQGGNTQHIVFIEGKPVDIVQGRETSHAAVGGEEWNPPWTMGLSESKFPTPPYWDAGLGLCPQNSKTLEELVEQISVLQITSFHEEV